MKKTSCLASENLQELDVVLVALNLICALNVLWLGLCEDSWDILFWVLDVLDTDDTLEENVLWSIGGGWWDDTRAIDEVDALHEGDVLPDLGLSWNWSDCAYLLVAESVDNGGFAGVWVSDETDGDLLAVGVEGGELAEELDQGALSEGVGDLSVESESWVVLGQVANPCSLK